MLALDLHEKVIAWCCRSRINQWSHNWRQRFNHHLFFFLPIQLHLFTHFNWYQFFKGALVVGCIDGVHACSKVDAMPKAGNIEGKTTGSLSMYLEGYHREPLFNRHFFLEINICSLQEKLCCMRLLGRGKRKLIFRKRDVSVSLRQVGQDVGEMSVHVNSH